MDTDWHVSPWLKNEIEVLQLEPLLSLWNNMHAGFTGLVQEANCKPYPAIDTAILYFQLFFDPTT